MAPFHQEHLNRHFPVDDTGIDPDKNRIQKKAQVSLTCAQ